MLNLVVVARLVLLDSGSFVSSLVEIFLLEELVKCTGLISGRDGVIEEMVG